MIKIIFFGNVKNQGLTEHFYNMALSISKYVDLLVVYDKQIKQDSRYLNLLKVNNIRYVDISELQESVDSCSESAPVLFHCNGFAHLRLAAKVARPIDKIILSVHCFRHALWYARFVAMVTYLLFFRQVDLWHFLSPKSRQEYFWFRGIPGNTCVFPLGVAEFFMTKAIDCPVIRDLSGRQMAESPDNRNIVYIARFQPWKRHIFLLESLRPILKGRVNLILIGEGPIRNKVEKAAERWGIRENVFFTGQVGCKTGHGILSKASLAVTVSPSETFGWCILEPFCMDVPVVTTDVGIANSIISDYYNGFVLNPDCTKGEFLEKVETALKCFSKVDNSPAKELYRWEKFASNTANCYNSVYSVEKRTKVKDER